MSDSSKFSAIANDNKSSILIEEVVEISKASLAVSAKDKTSSSGMAIAPVATPNGRKVIGKSFERAAIVTIWSEIAADFTNTGLNRACFRQMQYWMPIKEQLNPEASMLRYLMAVVLPEPPIQDWERLFQAISETLVSRLLREKQSYIEEVLATYWPPAFLETFEALDPAVRHPQNLDLMPPTEARPIVQAWAKSLTLDSPAFRTHLQNNVTLSFPLEAPIDPIAEEAQWAVEEFSLSEWLSMLLMPI